MSKQSMVADAAPTVVAPIPAEAGPTDVNTYNIGGTEYPISIAENGKIGDRDSAARSIIAFSVVSDQLSRLKKATKATDLQRELGIIDDEQAGAMAHKAAQHTDKLDAQRASLTTLMSGSSAFTVPQGPNATTTPANFVKATAALRSLAVTGAQQVLASSTR